MRIFISILLLTVVFYIGLLTARASEPIHLTPTAEPMVPTAPPPRTAVYLPYVVADFTEHYCDWLCRQ